MLLYILFKGSVSFFLVIMIDLVCEHIVVASSIAAVVCVILYFFRVISPKTTLYSVAVLGLPLIAFLFVYLAYEQLSLTGTTQLPSGAEQCKDL
jgi:hypothetical protein